MLADDQAVGLISNPSSGHNRDLFPTLNERIAASPVRHIVTRSAADIDAALAELAQANVRILGINGGDGTVSAILGALLARRDFPAPPAIVVLPGGTANMNAGDVGMRGSLQSAIERFCSRCDSGDWHGVHHQRAIMAVKLPCGSVTHGMFLGAGAVIKGTDYAHKEIHARGLRDDFSLALGTLRTVWGVVRGDPRFTGHQPMELQINHDTPQQHDALILALSTLHRLAFGMRPFWGTETGALRLTVMDQGCSRFLRTFIQIARGKPGANATPEQGYHSHNADSVAFTMRGKINLDGEIHEVDGQVTVSATPTLEFLAP